MFKQVSPKNGVRLFLSVFLIGLIFEPVYLEAMDPDEGTLLRVVVFDVANDPVADIPVELVDISGVTTDYIRTKHETDKEGMVIFKKADLAKFTLREGEYRVRIRVGEVSKLKEEREVELNPEKAVTVEIAMPYEGERPRGVAAVNKLFKRQKHREKLVY